MWMIEDWKQQIVWRHDRAVWRRPWHQEMRWRLVQVITRLITHTLNVPIVLSLDEGRITRQMWDELERSADPEAEQEEARQTARKRLEAARRTGKRAPS